MWGFCGGCKHVPNIYPTNYYRIYKALLYLSRFFITIVFWGSNVLSHVFTLRISVVNFLFLSQINLKDVGIHAQSKMLIPGLSLWCFNLSVLAANSIRHENFGSYNILWITSFLVLSKFIKSITGVTVKSEAMILNIKSVAIV